MENFTPIASTIGGVLIGLSAAFLMYFNGKIAGISGILEGVLTKQRDEFGWKLFFLIGMLVAGFGYYMIQPQAFAIEVDRALGSLAVAGLLVGIGTRMGSGCTSGHGVCGLARFSKRSFVATLTFMATGAITVFIVQGLLGGAL